MGSGKMSTKAEESRRLSQVDLLRSLQRDIQLTEMVTVYLSDVNELHDRLIYCALIPNEQMEESLKNSDWDLSYGEGIPCAVRYHGDGETRVEYLRYGVSRGIEPLVINRMFHDIFPDYSEISEEFRHFHELYHERKENHYFKIDESGNKQLVATVESERIQIRLKEIRQFLAVKEMHLSIQFDCREHSLLSLDELSLKEGSNDFYEDLMCWSQSYGDFEGINNLKAFSCVHGKKLIKPLPKEKSGFWCFAEEEHKKYMDFIIGIDDKGDNIYYTSNPDALANNFGSNPYAPNYLTPVHFRKEVLDKYYEQPGKYSVEDSHLHCGNLWGMAIDNHHDDKVCAWLGDLGRDLPYDEQLYWRSYNIPPAGKLSKTFTKRQILAQFTDSDRPEDLFGIRYHDLQTACNECLGWQLLLPLEPDDEHYYQCIRIPATDEQRAFDGLVQGLAKVLIDSLNEKYLNRLIPPEKSGNLNGSISILEVAFTTRCVLEAEEHIIFLRKLQDLRSSGVAHRKGTKYRKVSTYFGIDTRSLPSVFEEILRQALALLEYLTKVVRNGNLSELGTDGQAQ
ncbi:MAG: hypothetical protein NTW26_03715 [bacterium]|nr:hypothetical protein [bacterium]